MTSLLKDKTFRLSAIVTLIFLGTGLLFLMFGIAEYTTTLFTLLPITLGVAVGELSRKRWVYIGLITTGILFLFFMFALGLASLVCILFCLPIIAVATFIGYFITVLIMKNRKIKSTESLNVLLLPLILFVIAAPVETHLLPKKKKEVISVSSVQVFDSTPEQVYDAIKSVDTLDAARPLLMYIDLPIPTKCVLEKEEIGGLRTCYFKPGVLTNGDFGSGTITEKITEMERGKILKMDVIDYNLVGRDWLGFKEAIYYFEPVEGGRCKMTRVTTYTSELTPRFYWEPLEKLGIEQEHEFVFNNIEKDLGDIKIDRPFRSKITLRHHCGDGRCVGRCV
ncbi:MAG: polyketide cyclase [Bacteroidota bacterium]